MLRLFFPIVISFLFLLAGCSPKDYPVTPQEAISFAQNMETHVAVGDYRFFDSIFHPKPLAIKIAAELGKEASRSFINEVVKGINKGLQKFSFGNQISKNAKEKEGTYEYVNHYVKENKQHIIFRLDGSDGLNYHDFELVKIENKIGVADMFIYASGENLSKTLARIIEVLLDDSKKYGDQGIDDYAERIARIRSLMIGQQFRKAKQFYDELPERYKKEKVAQLLNISITSNLETEQYLTALHEFEKNFGNEPSTQLILFDSYVLNKDYSKALRALEVVDSALKGDPVLNFYRSLIYIEKNETEKAIRYLELLHKEKPDYSKGLQFLMMQYLQEKEIKKAEAIAKEYKRNKYFDKEKMEMVRLMYPEFSE